MLKGKKLPRKNNKNQYRYNDELDELFETSSGINDSEKKDAINDLLKKYPKMSRSIAGQIASGNYLISRYIGKINNKRKLDKINKIDDLLKKYPDMKRSEAGQIISGNLNLEEYKKSREIKLKKEVKKTCSNNLFGGKKSQH